MTIQNSKTYYLTIDEIQNTNPESLNSFRVAGKLILDSYNREKDSTMSTFNITDDGKILQASYTGVLPDMFFSSKSEQIILEGKLVGNGELFEAENVIVKCPSKLPFKSQTSRRQNKKWAVVLRSGGASIECCII